MSDQSKLGLGQIITTEQHRDAIHVAVAPMECADAKVWPSAAVGVTPDGKFTAHGPPVGIVDPFLNVPVYEGQRCWIYLKPGSITSLRHEWSHPAFGDNPEPNKSDVSFSEQWLRDYAERHFYYTPEEKRYEKLLSQIRAGAICYEGVDMHSLGDLEDSDELRKHASAVLGYDVKWESFEYFSCSC